MKDEIIVKIDGVAEEILRKLGPGALLEIAYMDYHKMEMGVRYPTLERLGEVLERSIHPTFRVPHNAFPEGMSEKEFADAISKQIKGVISRFCNGNVEFSEK